MMKKFALLAVAAAAVTAAASAQAQSSVTLFGVLDVAARNVKNGDDSVSSLSSGGYNSSRLGFRGTEDLGGGLSAAFWLEHGFNVDTGSVSDSSRFWNRRSTVALLGGFGEVRLGRDFSPTYTAWSSYDVFGDNGVAASGKFSNKLGTAVDTLTRADNQMSYIMPGMGGFSGQLSVATGEGTLGKKQIAGRVGYAAGPLSVSFGYGTTEVGPVGGEDKFKVTALGGSYDFGIAKLSGYYVQDKFADAEVVNYNVGASVPFGPGQFRASYIKSNAKGSNAVGASIDANDADQWALGYAYTLSKRTVIYASYARVSNDGAATYAVSSTPAAVAGATSTGYELGLRHAF